MYAAEFRSQPHTLDLQRVGRPRGNLEIGYHRGLRGLRGALKVERIFAKGRRLFWPFEGNKETFIAQRASNVISKLVFISRLQVDIFGSEVAWKDLKG